LRTEVVVGAVEGIAVDAGGVDDPVGAVVQA
jgi:hypothetical protein